MGKKYKKKVQWKQLSLSDIITPDSEKQTGDECEEDEEGDSAGHTPTHDSAPYTARHPYKQNFANPRRGNHHRHQPGFYPAYQDRRLEKGFDRYNSENFRNLENRGGAPFEKQPYGNKHFYERGYHYDKFYGRPPFYGERNFKFGGPGGFVDRGRRPFRPYGRPGGFFPHRGTQGHFQHGSFRDGHCNKGVKVCDGEEDDEEWDDEGILVTEAGQNHNHYNNQCIGDGGGGGGGGNGDRPSQPVHTVMINNEEYTKIQTPRQEVIFKKSSLDRKRDSIDQGSVTGSVTSGSSSGGSSTTTGGEHGSASAASGDQAAGDGSSVAGSVEDTSVAGDDPPDLQQQQDQLFEDPNNEIFAGEPGGPPLAGVVMQQAYPGGPMITIPVHWTPFIDPTLIPGETALTPLDPAFTHVIDPKSLPIDPLHVLPVQHDASGCPVHVQVKVDSNGVPIQIQPTAFTVSLSSLHQQQQQQQQGVLNQQQQQQQEQQHQQQDESHPQEQLEPEQPCEEQCQLEEVELEQSRAEHSSHPEEQTQEGNDSNEGQCEVEEHPRGGDEHVEQNSLASTEEEKRGHEEQDDGREQTITAVREEDDEEEEEMETQSESVETLQARRESSAEREEASTKMVVIEEHVDSDNGDDDGDDDDDDEEEEEEEEEGEKQEAMEVEEHEEELKTDREEAVERHDEIEEMEEVNVGETVRQSNEEVSLEDTAAAATKDTAATEDTALVKDTAATEDTALAKDTTTAAVAAAKDTATITTETITTATTTTPGVPSSTTPPEVSVEATRVRRNEEEEEEEEEVEEEEDMLTKEAEEASDSSDSQYASMSESSSTPTTPAGEPSDAHEAVEAQVAEACKNSSEAEPSDPVSSSSPAEEEEIGDAVPSVAEVETECATTTTVTNMETSVSSGTTETDQADSETTTSETNQTQEEAGDFVTDGVQTQQSTEATEKVLQGYVMVPILTPYYDPSVLYGYPVVVADQHQQHQHQHHQRGYSKRKKKKYQRRRHADVPAAGGYLDPQLYTGEPFVATPGGYVVPVEAAPSVCQVHGFQYVTAPFHPHPDEGFVQHSPYLQSLVQLDPATQAQLLGGTNQDDGSKRIFSDLQEKERRQIQEILQEQRAKVGKSDSTESSDSGVSESEEAVIIELSSDERDTHKDGEDASQPCRESSESLEVDDEASSSICEGERPSGTVEESEDLESADTVQERIDIEENSILVVPEVVDEVNAQYDLSGDNSIQVISCTSSDDQKQLNDYNASIQQDSDFIQRCKDSTSADDANTVISDQTLKDKQTVISDQTLKDKQNRHSSCNANDSEQADQDRSRRDSSKSVPSYTTTEDISKGSTENLNDLGNKSGFDFTEELQDTSRKTSESDSIQSTNQESEDQPLNSTDEDSFKHTVTSETAVCVAAEELPSIQEDIILSDTVISNSISCQRRSALLREGETNEKSIDQKSLKDLKVTEAVKRWIREVTPEKAFLLSEVQTRLIKNNIQGEMDTEDEYIEDEIPQTTQSSDRNSKNAEGNPFAAASSDATIAGMEGCSKRVAVSNKHRGTTPDTLDDYDGSSTISNLSYDHLYSEASSSQPASFSHSFDEEEVEKYTENPNMYNPVAYAKYYQLGVEVDETTPSATPLPHVWQMSREATPTVQTVQTESETISECGSEDIETVPHKYDVVCQYTATSPMSLATEILKAEKVLSNMSHITGSQQEIEASENHFGNPDIYLKHYGAAPRTEIGDSGVQSEESSDEMEGRSNVGSSGVGSSLASTPAISPAHRVSGRPPLQPHPLKNLSAGDGPVPCRTVCCAVM